VRLVLLQRPVLRAPPVERLIADADSATRVAFVLVRSLVEVLLVVGAVLATTAAVLVLIVHGGTCSPNEGGSGCGFNVAIAIPWIFAVGFAGAAFFLMARRR
jgi:hypothetical protein